MEATRLARAARESELATARSSTNGARGWSVRASTSSPVSTPAEVARRARRGRAEYGDAPRTVLAQANGKVGQQGAVADYLEVEAGYERAVEACLGDLLQHVIVERPEHAAAGFELIREQRRGRCGFLDRGRGRWREGRLIASRAPNGAAKPRPRASRPGVGGPRQRPVRGRDRRAAVRRGLRIRTTAHHCRRADRAAPSRRWRATCFAAHISSPAARRRRRAASSKPNAKSRICATRIGEERERLFRLPRKRRARGGHRTGLERDRGTANRSSRPREDDGRARGATAARLRRRHPRSHKSASSWRANGGRPRRNATASSGARKKPTPRSFASSTNSVARRNC